ncbi:hypothetical protein THAR02_02985 [Trichoderma harzianum]|uniref:Cytochrome P450 n=1 Tax=Trichoderma harzianum TaxID=5544 RepID=A0A0G0AIZ8_TRIHA|nr:hypothetical protein THAR02_02985 [Trichoderma harzianum]
MEVLKAISPLAAGHPVAFALWSLVFAFAFQVLQRGYRHRRFYRNLPGPPHSALWGHLKVLGEVSATIPQNSHPQAYYTEIARRYNLKGIFYLDLWPIADSSVVLTDPTLMEEVTVRNPLPQHTMSEAFLSPIIGPNVIATVNGPIWKRLHNAMAPAFSWSHIRTLTAVMIDECALYRAALAKYAKSGEVFSVEELSAKLIFDVIGRVVFNFRLHAQTADSPYLNDLRELVNLAHNQTDLVASYNPIARVAKWWKKRKVLGRLHPLILGKIKDRLDLLLNEGITPSRKDPSSILDLMLREHILQSESSGGAKTTKQISLSDTDTQLLLTNIKGLLLGGHGTTTDSLCYILMLLSHAPTALRKMRQEHDDVFGKDFDGTVELLLDTPAKLQDLPYTDAIIKESLRLFPVGFTVREADAGAKLTVQGRSYPIDKHQGVVLNGHDVHYNSDFFPNHTEFRPERWLDSEEGVPRSYFRTFGRGPRACLGQNLAMNELKVILLMVVRDFEFECAGLEPNAKPKTSYTNLDTVFGDVIFQELGIEARPRGGMMMTVKMNN